MQRARRAAAAVPRRGLAASSRTVADDSRYILGTYARFPVVLERGEGTRVWDEDGKEYLDFSSGIAVNALGHSDPAWARAIHEQANTLAHTSNLYYTKPATDLARRLVNLAPGLDRVFFCNSGTEANEAAMKFARRFYYDASRGEAAQPRPRFLSFEGAFHGRTMGALALTPKRAIQEPFEPLGVARDGVTVAPYNDCEAVGDLIDDSVAAVFVEAVQGEGGVRTATPEFLAAVRDACDRVGALLVLDEVQAGLGRTGRVWGHGGAVRPDIVTLAKPLAGGLPIGACLVSDEVASRVQAGDHGSTFAGNPLVCAAALQVLDRVVGPEDVQGSAEAGLLPQVRARGNLLAGLLRDEVQAQFPERVAEVRHGADSGLLLGLRLADNLDVGEFCKRAAGHGLLLPASGENTARFLPPLNVSEDEVREAAAITAAVVAAMHPSK